MQYYHIFERFLFYCIKKRICCSLGEIDPKFSNLENNLQTIRDNWDLVSYFFLNIITCDFELNLIKIILSYEYKIEYLVKQLEYDVKLIELTFLFFSVPFIPRA